jgi:hypothetical protein
VAACCCLGNPRDGPPAGRSCATALPGAAPTACPSAPGAARHGRGRRPGRCWAPVGGGRWRGPTAAAQPLGGHRSPPDPGPPSPSPLPPPLTALRVRRAAAGRGPGAAAAGGGQAPPHPQAAAHQGEGRGAGAAGERRAARDPAERPGAAAGGGVGHVVGGWEPSAGLGPCSGCLFFPLPIRTRLQGQYPELPRAAGLLGPGAQRTLTQRRLGSFAPRVRKRCLVVSLYTSTSTQQRQMAMPACAPLHVDVCARACGTWWCPWLQAQCLALSRRRCSLGSAALPCPCSSPFRPTLVCAFSDSDCTARPQSPRASDPEAPPPRHSRPSPHPWPALGAATRLPTLTPRPVRQVWCKDDGGAWFRAAVVNTRPGGQPGLLHPAVEVLAEARAGRARTRFSASACALAV